jgi:hypothetical protein
MISWAIRNRSRAASCRRAPRVPTPILAKLGTASFDGKFLCKERSLRGGYIHRSDLVLKSRSNVSFKILIVFHFENPPQLK